MRRAFEVWRALTAAEIREGRDLTIVGLAKWMLEPVSFAAIYFLFVAAILNRSRPAYPLFLMCALIPWRFFTGVVIQSMGVIRSSKEILLNRVVPTEILPLKLVGAEGASFLVGLFALVPLVIYYETDIWPSVLWLPVLIFGLGLISLGPTYLGSVFGLYFPDFRGPVQNLIRGAWFLSTGLVAAREIPGAQLSLLVKANPLSGIFDSFRAVFLYGRGPSLVDLLYPSAVGALLLVVGILVYRWRRWEFPKEV